MTSRFERTSAAGKPYCTALLRVPVDGEESMLASLIAFDAAAVQALSKLHKGDPVSVAEPGQANELDRQGRPGEARLERDVGVLYIGASVVAGPCQDRGDCRRCLHRPHKQPLWPEPPRS